MNTRCRICKRKNDPESMLLCDGCNRGHHTYCLKPKLKSIPEGDWYCKECKPKKRVMSPKKKTRRVFSHTEEEEEEEEEEVEKEEEEDTQDETLEEENKDSEEEQSDEEEEENAHDDEENEDDKPDGDVCYFLLHICNVVSYLFIPCT